MHTGELRAPLRIVARILAAGERAHPPDAANHWLKISTREHVARAMEHIDKLLVGANGCEDDLGHALTRLLLAVELRERLLRSEARHQGES
jgi:hypothetical protein